MRLVTVFKIQNCGTEPCMSPAPFRNQHLFLELKKTPDITTCCPLTANFQKSTTLQFKHDSPTVNLPPSARSRQLSFVHDLLFIAELIRSRSQTALETFNWFSVVFREPVCQLQTRRCPTHHTARFLQRLSNNEHVDGRPFVLQFCWAPNCQQMIVQTLAVCNTHWMSLLNNCWSTTQIERTVNQLLQKQRCPFDESQGHRHRLCFGTQRTRHCATHFKYRHASGDH